MKIACLLLILTLPLLSFSQVRGVVKDRETNKPIPYVNIWIEGEKIGATSDLQGNFSIKKAPEGSLVVYTAIGYTTERLVLEANFMTIYLTPSVIILDEVIITKNERSRFVQPFKKSDATSTFVCHGQPWIIARFSPYEEGYVTTPYLKSIRVLTTSKICEAKFNIRLYTVADNGQPKDYLYHKNILTIAKKGTKKTKVDLSELNILFPENGIFIAVESLIITENRPDPKSKGCNTSFDYHGEYYQPGFGSISSDNDKNSWFLIDGNWRKFLRDTTDFLPDKLKNKYPNLAVDLELSN